MTINQLHKITAKLIAQGAGRRAVAISKTTFKHALEEDGCTIINVSAGALRVIPMSDDDGGTAVTAKGREITRAMLVLSGDHEENDEFPAR